MHVSGLRPRCPSVGPAALGGSRTETAASPVQIVEAASLAY